MAYIKGLSVKLQGKWQDIVHAYSNIVTVIKKLKDVRSKIELFHSKWFDEVKEVASNVTVEPSVPRKTCRPMHQVNTPASSSPEYYMRAVTIPFLDHLISEISNRFNEHG